MFYVFPARGPCGVRRGIADMTETHDLYLTVRRLVRQYLKETP